MNTPRGNKEKIDGQFTSFLYTLKSNIQNCLFASLKPFLSAWESATN